MKTKLAVISILVISVFMLFGCLKTSKPTYKADLEVWGMFDSSDAFALIIGDYKKMNPYIGEIKYRKFASTDTYKKDVIDALASGQGPDIFLVSNNWLPLFKDKIEPAPEWILGEREFRSNFIDVVADNFIDEGKIWGSTLSVDSLALYYNKDLFNMAGITNPPATWEEFISNVSQLTKIDQYGNITQAGAALGTAENINRSTDVLTLLMLQKGAVMNKGASDKVSFDAPVSVNGQTVNPGDEALSFYTQFSNSSNASVYTWNPRMDYSIDSFYEGTTAMMINYSWHYETIKSKNSKLNFAVSQVPQFENGIKVNFANYWGFVVGKNKIIPAEKGYDNNVRTHEAWQFLKYLTIKNNGSVKLINGKSFWQCYLAKGKNCVADNSKDFPTSADPAKQYAETTRKPGARRDIIETQKSDPFLGPFAYGNLIDKTWHQMDSDSNDRILAEAINSIVSGNSTVYNAIKLAVSRIQKLQQ